MAATDIDAQDATWINTYAAAVTETFGQEFDQRRHRFNGGNRLLSRFTDAVDATLANGRSLISGVDEAHNELCIASALLASPVPVFALLEYEPALAGSDQTIDFRATTKSGEILFVDVKTINPKPTDRWEQFERAIREGWLPQQVQVTLRKEWLGGEIWHNMFAARSRMLEYTLELEAKIRDYKLDSGKASFALALCGEGFNWHADELEDFVAFYRTGGYLAPDPFSRAEARDMSDKKTVLDRTIERFACMKRAQFDVRQRRLNWNVMPPPPTIIGV